MQLWQGLQRLPDRVWPRPAVAATLLHLHKGLTLEDINVLWFIREWILPMLVRALGAVYVLRTDSSLLLAQGYWKCRWWILSSFLMIVYCSQRGLHLFMFLASKWKVKLCEIVPYLQPAEKYVSMACCFTRKFKQILIQTLWNESEKGFFFLVFPQCILMTTGREEWMYLRSRYWELFGGKSAEWIDGGCSDRKKPVSKWGKWRIVTAGYI